MENKEGSFAQSDGHFDRSKPSHSFSLSYNRQQIAGDGGRPLLNQRKDKSAKWGGDGSRKMGETKRDASVFDAYQEEDNLKR